MLDLQPAEALPRGALLDDKYRVGERIGAGGMGMVYAGMHEVLRTKVAIKALQPKLAADPAARERFAREARRAAQIDSVHCARIFDVGLDARNVPYMVMEYLAGETLEASLLRRGPLPAELASTIVLQTLDALAEAHHRGLVHRDLKPANLFLSERIGGGTWVKVLDFGISKASGSGAGAEADPGSGADSVLTAPRTLLGSPAYMAPEQLRGSSAVDAKTDTWAVGVVLAQLLQGRVPFRGDTLADLYAAILSGVPAWPVPGARVPTKLVELVRACLAKEPAERPNDQELAAALVSFASAEARPLAARIARFSSGPPRTRSPSGSRRGSTRALGASIVLCAGVSAFAAASLRSRPSAAEPATPVSEPATSPGLRGASAAASVTEPLPPAPSVLAHAASAAPRSLPAPRSQATTNGPKPKKNGIQNLNDIELLR